MLDSSTSSFIPYYYETGKNHLDFLRFGFITYKMRAILLCIVIVKVE